MRSHHMSRPALVVAVFALLSLLAGCGSTPIYFLYSPPLLYGMEGSDTSLLVIQQDGMYGYADIMGNVLIKPQYTYARPFCDGVAAVERNHDKFGYIDKTGKTAISFKYYGAADFHDGIAFVSDRLSNVGELNYELISVIDNKGNTVRQASYTSAGEFFDGIAFAFQYNSKKSRFDQIPLALNGTELNLPILDSNPSSFSPFSEGFAIVQPEEDGVFYFINKSGERQFGIEYMDAQPFSEGLAAVIPEKSINLWGYINVAGKQVITPSFRFAGGFGQGLALVEKPDKEWIIIDTSGNEICTAPGPVDITLPFSEGMCAVGRLKKESTYFHSPCPPYKLEYDWGFIDTTGKLAIDFQYDLVTTFKNGIAQVLVDGKIGYIDKTGKYIWEPK